MRCCPGSGRPPCPAADANGHDGARRCKPSVLGVPRHQLGKPVGCLIAAQDRGRTVGPHPPQLRPVVLVVVDQQRAPGFGRDVGQPLQPHSALRLGVDRGVNGVTDQGKDHRHEMWLTIGADRREPRHGAGGEPPSEFRFVHQGSVPHCATRYTARPAPVSTPHPVRRLRTFRVGCGVQRWGAECSAGVRSAALGAGCAAAVRRRGCAGGAAQTGLHRGAARAGLGGARSGRPSLHQQLDLQQESGLWLVEAHAEQLLGST